MTVTIKSDGASGNSWINKQSTPDGENALDAHTQRRKILKNSNSPKNNSPLSTKRQKQADAPKAKFL
jgi:hypothetical protein